MKTYKIWLFLEQLRPKPLWGLYYRGKWLTAKKVRMSIRMEGRIQKRQPYAYLYGKGRVIFREGTAHLI